MTGPTHKVYSICFAYITLMLFYHNSITEINYYLALIIVLMVSKKGALFPDLDHYWGNVHDKNVVTKIVNTLIHITGGKHRSWQTHSWDICIWFTFLSYYIPNKLYNEGKISVVNKEVAIIILLGFASGWISHLFSDMLTSGRVKIFCFIPRDYARWNVVGLTPRKIGKFKFNTGGQWEEFNYKFISILNKILGLICILYPLFVQGYLDSIINIILGGQ